ncbi:MAG: hypothetical protein LBI28_00985 [Treponema sp.]|jgi:hypothetical protein|nr:hypothetical protein [Treponema sp.]
MKNKLLIIAMVAVIGLSTVTCELSEMYESHAFDIFFYGKSWENKPDKADANGNFGKFNIEAKKVTWTNSDNTATWVGELLSLKRNDLGQHDAKLKITNVTGNNPHNITNGTTVNFNTYYSFESYKLPNSSVSWRYWIVYNGKCYYENGVVPDGRKPVEE